MVFNYRYLAVIAFSCCLCVRVGYAGPTSSRNQRSTTQDGRAKPHGFESVADYLQRGLQVDLEDYDLGEKIRLQLQRMNIEGDLRDQPEVLKQLNRRVFSELSVESIARLFRGLQKSRYPNGLVLAEAGVGKTFLVEQLAWLLAYGVMPDYLRERLNLVDPATPAAQIAEDFLGRTNVILVNEILLTQQEPQRGAAASEETRTKNVLANLFRYAKKEYNHGEGNRTVFIFEEVAQLPSYIHNALKPLLDKGGYQPRGQVSFGNNDPGYHVYAFTTPGEYNRMVKGDSAIDRRYTTKVKIFEPTEEAIFKVVRRLADDEWQAQTRGIHIEDRALDYMIHMRRYLDWPPLAAPQSVIAGTENLFAWKTQHPGSDPFLITLRDAQLFFRNVSGLTDIWFEGPNGEPPMTGLADRVKELVVGQDDIIEKIAHRITTWVRLGQGRQPPVFFLGGPTGSGKDTIVMAFNMVLFGHPGTELMFNMAGKEGHAVDAILEGPPIGNHSDDRPALLQAALDGGRGTGLITFNEAYDMPAAEFEKLKIFIERGELRPMGLDARPRPLRYPIFIIGQFGEGLFMAEDGSLLYLPNQELSNELIDLQFTQGKEIAEGRIGAVPQALLDRGKATGGVYIVSPVHTDQYGEIITIWMKVLSRHLMRTNQIEQTLDPKLVELMVDVALKTGLMVRGLSGIMSDFTEGAISKAIDMGLPGENIKLHMTLSEDGKSIRVVAEELGKSFEFTPDDLLRLQSSCPSGFAG